MVKRLAQGERERAKVREPAVAVAAVRLLVAAKVRAAVAERGAGRRVLRAHMLRVPAASNSSREDKNRVRVRRLVRAAVRRVAKVDAAANNSSKADRPSRKALAKADHPEVRRVAEVVAVRGAADVISNNSRCNRAVEARARRRVVAVARVTVVNNNNFSSNNSNNNSSNSVSFSASRCSNSIKEAVVVEAVANVAAQRLRLRQGRLIS